MYGYSLEDYPNDWCPNFNEGVNVLTQNAEFSKLNIEFFIYPDGFILD